MLIKLPEVKKKMDKMAKKYLFLLLSSLIAYSTIKLWSCDLTSED